VRGVAGAVVVLLAGCDTIADGRVFEVKIKDTLEQSGTIVTVDCPDRIPLGRVETNKFRCQVVLVAERREIEIAVSLDAKGTIEWREAR
jgi:hypothetical protein